MTKANIRKVLWIGAFVILAGAALPTPASANDLARPGMHHASMHHHHHHHHHHHMAPTKHS
jgi:hypothetical protein